MVAALAGGVAYALTRDQTPSYQVPHLAGLAEAEALNQISGFDWDTVVTREASDTVPAGIVIRTQPDEATSVQEKKPFQLVVSTGPAPRPLPDLVGLTLEEATSRLEQLGLVLQQADPVFDETVPLGIVLSWMVPEQPGLRAGDTVTPDTTVRVVLSAGPQPRTVPNLTGMTVEQAAATLQPLGLVLAQLPPEFERLDRRRAHRSARPADRYQRRPRRRDQRGRFEGSRPRRCPTARRTSHCNRPRTPSPLRASLLAPSAVSPRVYSSAAQYQGVDVLPGQQLPRGSAIDVTFA